MFTLPCLCLVSGDSTSCLAPDTLANCVCVVCGQQGVRFPSVCQVGACEARPLFGFLFCSPERREPCSCGWLLDQCASKRHIEGLKSVLYTWFVFVLLEFTAIYLVWILPSSSFQLYESHESHTRVERPFISFVQIILIIKSLRLFEKCVCLT